MRCSARINPVIRSCAKITYTEGPFCTAPDITYVRSPHRSKKIPETLRQAAVKHRFMSGSVCLTGVSTKKSSPSASSKTSTYSPKSSNSKCVRIVFDPFIMIPPLLTTFVNAMNCRNELPLSDWQRSAFIRHTLSRSADISAAGYKSDSACVLSRWCRSR